MKTVEVGQADLNNCVTASQSEPIMLTRKGAPIALILGINGMDAEQIELGISSEFWKLIESRRAQPTLSRQELDDRLAE
jgi:hypothetical protein